MKSIIEWKFGFQVKKINQKSLLFVKNYVYVSNRGLKATIISLSERIKMVAQINF